MDTLYWSNLSLDVKFKETKKQFWGRYLWRMEIYADCADVAFEEDPQHAVAMLKYQAVNRSNFGGSWRQPYFYNNANKYENVNYTLLGSIKTIKESLGDIVKIRVESDRMQFYAGSESELKQIAAILSDTTCIEAITGPKAGTEQLLISNAIIAPKIPFKYKILLRDGNYNLELKTQILNLLESQEDIKITAGLRHNLNRPWPGMWGAFFYANDLGITTMLNLMSPGIVGKIHEVVQA